MANTNPAAGPISFPGSRHDTEVGLYLSEYEHEMVPGDHSVVSGRLDASVLDPEYTRHLIEKRLDRRDVTKLQRHYGRDLRVAALVATRLTRSEAGEAQEPIYDFMIVDGGLGSSYDAALVYIEDARLDVEGRAGVFDKSQGRPTNILPLDQRHPIHHIWNPRTGINRLTVGLNAKGDYYLVTPSLLKTEVVGGRYHERELGQSIYVETPRVSRISELKARASRKFGPIVTRLATMRGGQRAA